MSTGIPDYADDYLHGDRLTKLASRLYDILR